MAYLYNGWGWICFTVSWVYKISLFKNHFDLAAVRSRSKIPLNPRQCEAFRKRTLRQKCYCCEMDVILHVEDLSSKNFEHQRIHVFNTLENLSSKMGVTNIQKKLISVGNKCDIADESNKPTLRVSSTTEAGIDVLKHKLEETILKVTDRHLLNISLPIGGDEVRWLYKNATVIGIKEDGENMENNIVTIIISEAKLSQFKYNFVNS